MLTFPNGFDFVKQDLDNYGVWEPRTTKYIQDHLKAGQVFVDVGAQVGYFSLLAKNLGAIVIAFEPSTANRECLKNNVPNITIDSHALSNVTSNVNKLFKGKTPGENSLDSNYHNGNGEFEEVETARFDDLHYVIPDFVKIDIEGHERQALEGMTGFLTATKPLTLIVEDWDGKTTKWLVEEHGFNLVTTDRGSGNSILTKNQPFVYEEEPIRCHLVGTFSAPNTKKDEGISNSISTKVVNMAKVLKKLGYYVIFYGVEGSEVECDEFVPVSTMEVLEQTYGELDKNQITPEKYGDLAYKTFTANAIREILARKRNMDFLLLCYGTFQKEIADGVQIPNTVEIGIGHRSSFAKFRIFESFFQQSWTYGREDQGDGDFYDCVIPGFFDPDDFTYSENKENYYLYLGRIISKKGIFVAQQVCEKLGKRLIVAGVASTKENNASDYNAFQELIKMPNVEYIGFAGSEKRRELMSKAKAVFMPTLYLEPFGYVAIEANLSGTPVISTDFGGFTETVQDGVNGFRCRNFREFVETISHIDTIKPMECRNWAEKYTLNAVAPMYKRYFTQILELATPDGWYKL